MFIVQCNGTQHNATILFNIYNTTQRDCDSTARYNTIQDNCNVLRCSILYPFEKQLTVRPYRQMLFYLEIFYSIYVNSVNLSYYPILLIKFNVANRPAPQVFVDPRVSDHKLVTSHLIQMARMCNILKSACLFPIKYNIVNDMDST